MTRLEEAIQNIVEVFLEYAGDDPKKPKLCQEELKNMLENEIKSPEIRVRDTGHWHDTETSERLLSEILFNHDGVFPQEQITADDIEEAMQKLDKNHDGEVNFREFSRCVMDLAKSLYHNKTGRGGKKGRGKGNEDE